MKYEIPIKRETYHLAVLKMLNPFLNLTDYEMEIISAMLKNEILILTSITRKNLKGILNKDTFTFNNYIKRLKDKGTLIKTEKGLELNSGLRGCFDSNEFTFKFNLLS